MQDAARAPLGRRQWFKAMVAIAAGVPAGAVAYGSLYERHRIGVTRATLPVTRLPAAAAGLRVALVTDLHHSATMTREDIDAAVAIVHREAPDLVVLGGDYVTWGDRAYVEPCAEAVGALRAPLGVFAILGNHDDERHMPAALARQGIEVLRDARTTIIVKGEPLDLVGLRFWTRKPSTIADLVGSSETATLLLAHDPRRLKQAAALGVSLVLSGHTHGGQVVLPVLGPLAGHGRGFPILEGTTYEGSTLLFVSRGLGTVYVPFRLNCPPEVAILTLEPRTG